MCVAGLCNLHVHICPDPQTVLHMKSHRHAGVECDISVASGAARFKSTVLRYLADIDPRFSSLVRLVKLWAGAHGMNDAASGTFNSFALTLMVSHRSFTS